MAPPLAPPTADAYGSMKAALELFRAPPAAPAADVPGRQELLAAAEQIRTDAAKIGVVCSGAAAPDDQLASLAAALCRSVSAFCATSHAATAAAGPSLKASLEKLTQGVVTPCLGLVSEMGSGGDLKAHVALVWDALAAVGKAPVDNKGCLFAGLAKVMAVVKDTQRELEELQQEQQERFGANGCSSGGQADAAAAAAAAAAANGHSPADGSSCSGSSDAGDLDPDLDFEAEQMSHSELALLSGCLQLLGAVSAVVRAFGRALLQTQGQLCAGTEALEGWESCLWHTQHLRRAVEDLGAAMYPPQDLEEVAGAALAVYGVSEMMADECPDAESVGAAALAELGQTLAAAHERLQQLLARAKEQQDGEGTEEQEADEQQQA